MKDPDGHSARLLGLWDQIATRYREQPQSVAFEVCNEPVDITAPQWNRILEEAIAVIRRTNPRRLIIIGGIEWSSIDGMRQLALPAGDRSLIATFHYYSPVQFTHQDAYWIKGSEAWAGTAWRCTA